MNWIENMNYIENHLLDKIDYNELARIAYCPPQLFEKMFFYMTKISLS